MKIYIHKNDQKLGPFYNSQIQEALTSGEICLEDLAWIEGLTEWVRLGDLLQKPQKITAPVQARPTAKANFIHQSISGGEITPSMVAKKNEPLSIWALVLGIVSLISCLGGFFVGIPAVICGHVGLSRIKRQPLLGGHGMAIAGLITGYLSILIAAILAVPLLVYGTMDFIILPQFKKAAGIAKHANDNGMNTPKTVSALGEGAAAFDRIVVETPKTVSALGEHTAEFGSLVVRLSGTGSSKYLRTNFKVASANAKIGDIINQNDAPLRDAATTIISAQSSASLDNPNGREALRKQLIAQFNNILGAEVIDQIYFSEFSIQ